MVVVERRKNRKNREEVVKEEQKGSKELTSSISKCGVIFIVKSGSIWCYVFPALIIKMPP